MIKIEKGFSRKNLKRDIPRENTQYKIEIEFIDTYLFYKFKTIFKTLGFTITFPSLRVYEFSFVFQDVCLIGVAPVTSSYTFNIRISPDSNKSVLRNHDREVRPWGIVFY